MKCGEIRVTPLMRSSSPMRRIVNSQGMATKTGPLGGAIASLNARCSTIGNSCSVRTSCAHLVYWRARSTRLDAKSGSCVTSSFCCWQHRTTSGACERQALNRLPMAWAMPGVTCTTSTPGLPVIRAEPIAAPMAMFSCRHSMYSTWFSV
ncbi:Uncharacterised protein [Chromobacterium violaceum]|uniref:Uncharacterized protein n=1 Tax=Chromobacterium violaceum TaxID=536 RepID=A0A447TGK6_CHRVL|nr:Uncharacterised protein [Chromobacterium violaceum]